MKVKILTILIFITAGLSGIAAEAARENPFKSQLPAKAIDKPPTPVPVTTQTTTTPGTTTQPEPQPKARQERVFLPPPPIAVVTTAQTAMLRPPDMIVSGIIWNSQRPQAIINNTIVDIGDKIDGAEITGIEKNAISYSFNGQTFKINQP